MILYVTQICWGRGIILQLLKTVLLETEFYMEYPLINYIMSNGFVCMIKDILFNYLSADANTLLIITLYLCRVDLNFL